MLKAPQGSSSCGSSCGGGCGDAAVVEVVAGAVAIKTQALWGQIPIANCAGKVNR